MAHVVLLRGVNVGGHRTFRPTALAKRLAHLDVVNIGAAGTFVVRRQMSRARVRAEFERQLPFETEIVVCAGCDVAALIDRDIFAGYPVRRETVRFVSVLSKVPRTTPSLPLSIPPTGPWLVRVLAREKQFIFGVYRRQMKVIGSLGTLDTLFGAPVTTRSWSTFATIARNLTVTRPAPGSTSRAGGGRFTSRKTSSAARSRSAR